MVRQVEKAIKGPGVHPGAALGSARPGWPSPDSRRPRALCRGPSFSASPGPGLGVGTPLGEC